MLPAGMNVARVDTIEEASQFLGWITQQREILAVDTETTGRDWWLPNFTRLVQFGDSEMGWTLSVKHWWGVIQHAFEIIESRDIPVVAHNAKFDMHAIRVAGFTVPPRHLWHDTYLMHTLLYPLKEHGLKDICEEMIDSRSGYMANELKKLMTANKWTWATIPYESPLYSVYGGADVILCARLFGVLKPQIELRFPEPYEVELQTANILYRTEFRGMRVDLDYCERLLGKYQREMEILAGKLGSFGITNPNSDAEIVQYLMDEEDWEPTEYTDKGNIKFNKDVKETLDFEIVKLQAEYGKRLKLSSYVDKMLTMNDNGIVYPSIKTIQARTGRMSIGSDQKETGTGKPVSIPFQQLPHIYETRRMILPRWDGYVMRPIDYDSQEIRVLAHYSQCLGLMEMVRAGVDIHSATAEMILHEKIEKDDPRRNVFKMNRYLQVYGGGVAKLALKAGISVEDAQRFKELDNATFPEIKQFMRQVQDIGKNRYKREGRGYIESWGGREIEVDAPKYIDGELAEFWYKLSNYIIQGSCADLLKRKIIDLDAAGLMEWVDLPVHDELVTSVPDTPEGDEIAHEIKDMMEELEAFTVPLTCELSNPYLSWGEKYLRKGEIPWDRAESGQDESNQMATLV